MTAEIVSKPSFEATMCPTDTQHKGFKLSLSLLDPCALSSILPIVACCHHPRLGSRLLWPNPVNFLSNSTICSRISSSQARIRPPVARSHLCRLEFGFSWLDLVVASSNLASHHRVLSSGSHRRSLESSISSSS